MIGLQLWQAIRAILREEAERAGVSVDVLVGDRRFPALVEGRDRAIRRLHDELGLGPTQIARHLGRHHATVLYSLRKTEAQNG